MKYLHVTGPHTFYLDHRLLPEVRAMLCAMVSRAPVGGIRQRYLELVQAVQADEALDADAAEDRLCVAPLTPKVQGFFNSFVRAYGHSSVMELVGSPSVVIEGVSWWTNWLLFDSPLCRGQEFSTRAVQRQDWPMAAEVQGNEELARYHQAWMEVFEAEVEAWKTCLEDPEVRRSLGIADKEPFRPALDRARWALPGTIATGSAHTSDLRERARVIREGEALGDPAIWAEIKQAYREALPGLAGMGLREAVYSVDTLDIPGHLAQAFQGLDVPSQRKPPTIRVDHYAQPHFTHAWPYDTHGKTRTYRDPLDNRLNQVRVQIPCSLAVARDWHRHRTFYPWVMTFVVDAAGLPVLDPHYAPRSALGKERLPELLAWSARLWKTLPRHQAPLAAFLGQQVILEAQGGLRDAQYTFELRRDAHGANFEYQEQATDILGEF